MQIWSVVAVCSLVALLAFLNWHPSLAPKSHYQGPQKVEEMGYISQVIYRYNMLMKYYQTYCKEEIMIIIIKMR